MVTLWTNPATCGQVLFLVFRAVHFATKYKRLHFWPYGSLKRLSSGFRVCALKCCILKNGNDEADFLYPLGRNFEAVGFLPDKNQESVELTGEFWCILGWVDCRVAFPELLSRCISNPAAEYKHLTTAFEQEEDLEVLCTAAYLQRSTAEHEPSLKRLTIRRDATALPLPSTINRKFRSGSSGAEGDQSCAMTDV